MTVNELVLQPSEKIIFALRQLYLANGYRHYKMSKFEEYDLYVGNKDFLVSDNVITFTDTGGKLMALKPDVTLSIIKNSTDTPDGISKVFYNENVYRVSKNTGSFGEIMQAGVECFGNVGFEEICEVLKLSLESLNTISNDNILTVSDLDILAEFVEKLGLDDENKKELYLAIGDKNISKVEKICSLSENAEYTKKLKALISLHGSANELLPKLKLIVGDNGFVKVLEKLANKKLHIDFSVSSDVNYYNGIVFKGYIKGIPTAVLSGGQYDKLMRKFARKSKAIGFAVYTDMLERFDECENTDEYINIALPKGRLGEKVYSMFEKAGYECPSILEPNRKLIFENSGKKVRYFWVKPSDVAIYVERGAADIGVAGKDILLEYSPDVYELADLKCGKCRMAVAAPKGFSDDDSRTLKVATKFANIAKSHYLSKGRDIDIIHLNGSIEIAPILGLSDVIVDIVETGTTLKENNLEVIENIVPISARLIANKSSFKFKGKEIENLADGLKKVTEEI